MKSLLCRIEMAERREQIIKAGTFLFPINAYFNDLYQMPTKEVPWHWHKDLEAIYIAEGSAMLYYQKQQTLLQEGDGVLINSSVLHSVKPVNENCIFYSFVFSPHLIASSDSLIAQKYITPVITNHLLPAMIFSNDEAWKKEAAQCIYSAFMAYEQGKVGYEITIREQLSHMWNLMVQFIPYQHGNRGEASTDLHRVKKMIAFIDGHFTEQITLHDIAHSAEISDREALRCFQKIIHDSPISYVVKQRITQATELLSNSDLTITQISSACGFENPSYFSRVFKSWMDCTPKAYRKSIQEALARN